MRRADSDGGLTSGPNGRTPRPPISWLTFAFWITGVTVLILVLGDVAGPLVRLAPFLIFLPAFIAGVGTVRQTAAASVWVVLMVAASLSYRDVLGDSPIGMAFTAAFGGLSVAGCWYRVRRDAEVTRLRSAAAALQRQILRPLPLRTDQVTVDGLYRPVEEDGMVGGDIYEVAASPYGTRVLIADVQGKGVPAIGVGFAVLEAFRENAHRESNVKDVADAMENAVVRHNAFAAQSGESERFVTALILNIGAAPQARVVNCGHVPPHVLHGDRTGPVQLAEPGPPLGLDRLTAGPRAVELFDFPAEATLLLCTDGVTEARDKADAFYPLAERLPAWDGLESARVAELLGADLRRFTADSFRDDIAVLAVHRRPAALPTPPGPEP